MVAWKHEGLPVVEVLSHTPSYSVLTTTLRGKQDRSEYPLVQVRRPRLHGGGGGPKVTYGEGPGVASWPLPI